MDESRSTSRKTTHPAVSSPEQRRPAKPDEVSAADLRQTIAEVLRVLILRRWVLFIPFCLATTAAFIASHYVPRTFEASTTFEQANDAVSVNLPPGLLIAKYEFFRSTLVEDMRSDEVMGPIVEDLGLARDLPREPDGTLTEEGLEQRAGIGRGLATGVEVVSWKKAPFRHVIRLHYTGADPEVMVRLLKQMKEGYIGLVRRKVADKLRDARDWYTTRVVDKRTVLEEIDRQVTALQIAHPGIDPSNPESIAFQLT
ncbi:MAG: hypothetical protein GY778_29530, partial [bacterium]|nr:hypothetical protein [bacterium]